MENRQFKFMLGLIEEGDSDSALYLLRENAPESFDLLRQEMFSQWYTPLGKTYGDFYSQALRDDFPHLIHAYLQKEYEPMDNLFIHVNAYLYGSDPCETFPSFDKFITKIIRDIRRMKINPEEPVETINKLNESVAKQFLLESQSESNSNLKTIMEHQTVSQYALAILYIILGERLGLPIFGLPLEGKLILVFTKAHCDHNEMVYADDIQNYFIVGEKDIIYTPLDLELLAIMKGEILTLEQKLPRSNQFIIRKWIENLVDESKDSSTKNMLSIKYQQILECAAEFEVLR